MIGLLFLAAAATPTYLSCQLSNDKGSRANYDLALNESAGTAGIIFSTGYTRQQLKAAFSPTSVSIDIPGSFRRNITVSRIDLSISDIIVQGDASIVLSGACEIAPPVDRRF